MIEIKSFTFNPFNENTYLLSNKEKETIIIDPGAYSEEEQELLIDYIQKKQLQPTRLLNTHCHLDHVFSNQFMANQFGLLPEIHPKEKELLTNSSATGLQYGLPFSASPTPKNFLSESDHIYLGAEKFEILWTPGHSPGSICFYCPQQNFLIGGDVLFRESIGRTDLPGGDSATLLTAIREKIYPLPDDTVIYPGHGPKTTIGYEKQHNPFIR